jgi:MFS superfamily sulfate permease-like transporter
MAALGGILVVTGWRLISLKHVRHLFENYGPIPAGIWAATFALVVTTDLLTGVLAGLALSLVELIPFASRLKLKIDHEEGEARLVRLSGSATFLTLPRLTRTLDALPADKPVHLDLDNLHGLDHTSAELLGEWLGRRRRGPARLDQRQGSDVAPSGSRLSASHPACNCGGPEQLADCSLARGRSAFVKRLEGEKAGVLHPALSFRFKHRPPRPSRQPLQSHRP